MIIDFNDNIFQSILYIKCRTLRAWCPCALKWRIMCSPYQVGYDGDGDDSDDEEDVDDSDEDVDSDDD